MLKKNRGLLIFCSICALTLCFLLYIDVNITEAAVKPAARINVKDYGAKGDGETNDRASIQAAADAAQRKGRSLYIPPGTYYISSPIEFWTSVLCEGKILVPTSLTGKAVIISRSVPGKRLRTSDLSGLQRGSAKINGLSGYKGGTLVFSSSEQLIVRDGYSENYTCNEAMQITDAKGAIFPVLDCTYTKPSRLTAMLYPYEKPIYIVGLSIELQGNSSRVDTLVCCRRSNVIFNNIKVINRSDYNPAYGFLITECVNITINNPVISNFDGGNKYGFSLDRAANITINNANINNAYHALSGLYVKNVKIKGGYWDKVIDCHWGSDYVIDGAAIMDAVQFCGTNITIRNCNYKGTDILLKIRKDTPEMMGSVILDKISVRHLGTGQLYGVYYPDWSPFGRFGRKINTPNLISVTNITADLADNQRKFYVVVTPYKLSETNSVAPIKTVIVKDIKVDEGEVVSQKTR